MVHVLVLVCAFQKLRGMTKLYLSCKVVSLSYGLCNNLRENFFHLSTCLEFFFFFEKR